jgi:hypothetical protein
VFIVNCVYCKRFICHLGPIFFILDINAALDIFENVSVLGYADADDLKLFMTIKCVAGCQLFQRDLDRLNEWCSSNKFDLNAGKCKSISFRRNMRPIEFVYSINATALERVRRLPWRVWPLPANDARCLLIGLEVLFVKRIVRVPSLRGTFWLAG